MYLCSARLKRIKSMRFRRSRRASATVTSCSAAKKNDYISVCGDLTSHVFLGSSRYNCTYLHTLCYVSVVIKLINNACSKSNLISVRRISCRRSRNYLSLRKLSWHCLGNRLSWVCSTCNTHRAINVSSSRKRIANRAANTSCRAAKGFDFGRMVMCFIFKQKQPIFLNTVYRYFDFYGTRIYFFRFIKLCKHSFFLKIFCGYRTDIHKIYRLCSSKLFSYLYIFVIR